MLQVALQLTAAESVASGDAQETVRSQLSERQNTVVPRVEAVVFRQAFGLKRTNDADAAKLLADECRAHLQLLHRETVQRCATAPPFLIIVVRFDFDTVEGVGLQPFDAVRAVPPR